MSVRIIVDRQDGNACMFDSTTMRAFGPVFDYFDDDPEDFLTWLADEDPRDVRTIPAEQLDALVAEWIATRAEAGDE